MASFAKQPSQLIWRLVEESMWEAAFLWQRLDVALDAPEYRLCDVERWVEERLVGALDGVRIAGAAAVESVLPEALQDADLGGVAAATYLLATLDQPDANALLEDRVRDVAPEHIEAIARGLGRSGNTALLERLWSRLARDAQPAQATVLRAFAFCQHAPTADFRGLLEATDVSLRRAAAETLQFVSSNERDRVVSVALASPDPVVQTNACLASVCAGDVHGWRACVDRMAAPSLHSLVLAPLVAALGGDTEHACMIEALAVPELRSGMLWGLGFAGTKAAAEACLAQLRAGCNSAQATTAFMTITGMKQAGTSQPTEAASDNKNIESWWAEQSKHFEHSVRYVDGKVATLQTLRAALEDGPAQRRHAIARELTARSGGAFRMQTLAFCSIQRAQQAQLASIDERQLVTQAASLGARPLGST